MEITFPKELAELYDPIFEDSDYNSHAKAIAALPYPTQSKTCLELGIGTGLLAQELIKLGFEVEGVDHSPAMLERAKTRLPSNTTLHNINLTELELNKKFPLIVSFGGPIRLDIDSKKGLFMESYIKSRNELKQALEKIAQHLESGGIFVMSIQANNGMPKTRKIIEGTIRAVSEITNEGDFRIKNRQLLDGEKVLTEIKHTFLTLSLEELNSLMKSLGFSEGQINPTSSLYFFQKL